MNKSPAPFLFDPTCYPQTPGVYLMRDEFGKVIFVGMAKNLRRRLDACFDGSQRLSEVPLPGRLRYLDVRPQLIERVREIEVVLLHNEADCLILVNNLIRRHRPYFNLATYMELEGTSFIVQTAEAYPRFLPVGKGRLEKNALKRGLKTTARFGPLPSAARDTLLKCINETFGLRTCDPLPGEVCIAYRLGHCSGPCEGKISAPDYAARVAQAAGFLAAPPAELMGYLDAQMQAAAGEQEFERARRIRDRLMALRAAFEQPAEEPRAGHNQDVIYTSRGKGLLLRLERGRLESVELFDAPVGADPTAEYLFECYGPAGPDEIILGGDSLSLPDPAPLAARLTAARGRPVSLTIPEAGLARDWLEVARANHEYRVNGVMPKK